MYTCDKTTDAELIKSVLAHPAVYPTMLHDDFAPPREEWEPVIHPKVMYFAVRKDGDLIGMFMANLHNAIEVEIHSGFLPKAWGRDVRAAAQQFREWIWRETGIQRIIGRVLASNRASLNYAEVMGFKQWGVDEKSFMRGGKLQDQICFGMSRPEAL